MRPGSVLWLARHEARLAWREALARLTGGKPRRGFFALAGALLLLAAMHWLAGELLRPWIAAGIVADRPTLLALAMAGLLAFSVMLSQAMESVTRTYYGRADLDLLLASPLPPRRIFAVRTASVVATTSGLACLLASPAVNVLAWHLGPPFLAAYGVLAALGALAAALALLLVVGLFRLFGPRRTRVLAQVLAAIVGAGFLIGLQAVAILSFGSLSRFAALQSDALLAAAPGRESLVFLPARAALGDPLALLLVLALGAAALALALAVTASGFGRQAIAAAGIESGRPLRRRRAGAFRPGSQAQALRRKEWRLLARDPWLISQTLMQILYLLPPGLLLWINYGHEAGALVVIVPVLVMAAGQLAGGLAWLALSGEDAPDLVAAAPVPPRRVLLAKIEAVTSVVALVLAPLLLPLAFASPMAGLAALAGGALAAASATAIQVLFQVRARRAQFRRRQTASRVATIAEALSSILWAGAAALLSAGSVLAALPALLALAVLGLARLLRPARAA